MTVTSISTANAQFRPQGPPPPRTPPPMAGTAKLLGMSTDELRDAQRSGTTLTDLATQTGVSKDDLVKSVAADMKVTKPQDAPELSEAQLTEMATNIADGKRPQGPPPSGAGGAGGAGRYGSDDDSRVQANVSALAEALGTDTETLLQKLRSGADLATLRGGASATATGYGAASTSASALFTGGLAVDRYA